jgi:polar amino acid transport system substrate-binding protein
MMRRATVCGVSAVCALLVCGTPSSSQAQETDAPLAPLNKALADQVPPDIRQKGLLTVVMSTSNPPAHVVDEKTKTMIGMDPDIGRALADELGLKEQVTGVEITQAIPGMQAGAISSPSP